MLLNCDLGEYSLFCCLFVYIFIFLLYNTVLVLPYIDMNLPWVYMCSHPDSPSHLFPYPIPLGHPSAPAPSILYRTWTGNSFLTWYYTFPWHSPESSHPLPLPQNPKVCSIHLCLFCCLTYRVRVPWIARRSNQSILKEISPGISLEGMMLKLKLQYFGYLMQRVDSL